LSKKEKGALGVRKGGERTHRPGHSQVPVLGDGIGLPFLMRRKYEQ